VLKKPQPKAPVKNTIGPFKLTHEVRSKPKILLILDLVVPDMSDHPLGGYELVLKGYELFVNGKIIEKAPRSKELCFIILLDFLTTETRTISDYQSWH
jgi:hypothetical protein